MTEAKSMMDKFLADKKLYEVAKEERY